MNTKLHFHGGPFDGVISTLDFPESIADISTLKPDTVTLELPAGLDLQTAVRLGQARVITETTSPASFPGKILRFRNAEAGHWHYVNHAV